MPGAIRSSTQNLVCAAGCPTAAPIVQGRLDQAGCLEWDSVSLDVPGISRLVATTTNTHCLGPGNVANVDPDHRVPEFEGECDIPSQAGAHLMGVACRSAFVCRSCRCNAHNALCNRHCKKRPDFTGDFAPAREWFNTADSSLFWAYMFYNTIWQLGWIYKWGASKIAAIVRSQQNDPLEPSMVELMVKREALTGFKNKARGIQKHTNLASQAVTGPSVTSAQKAVGCLYGVDSPFVDGIQFVFASGLNGIDVGRWMQQCLGAGLAWFYERDGANWDATMGRPHHDMKQHVYAKMDPQLVEDIEAMYGVRGVFRSRKKVGKPMRYEVRGTTRSGHNDTSIGNSIINFSIACTAIRNLRMSGKLPKDCRASCLVMGDDLLVAMSCRPVLEDMVAEEKALGITPEARVFDSWEDVTFISSLFYPTDGGIVFGPRPGAILAKLFWTVKYPGKGKKAAAYVNGIVDCMYPIFRGWPILDAFVRSHRIAGVNGKTEVGWKLWTDGLAKSAFDSTTASWFSRRYGLSVEEISEAEELLLTNAGRAGIMSTAATRRIVERDLAGLEERELMW